MQIIPAILVKSAAEFLQQTQAIQTATDLVHLDITDGNFVPETTWSDPEFVSGNLNIECELHLMVKNPLAIIEQWKNVPQVKRILFHAESEANIAKTIAAIHAQDWEAIVVLNPETPANAIEPYANDLDGVMAMSIHPGAQGRAFMPEVLVKLNTLKQTYPSLITQIDGGINAAILPIVNATNIDRACIGSAIFGHGHPAENLANLQKLID